MGIRPKLPGRWQPAQLVAEVGGVEVARDPEGRALRAANKRLAREPDTLKKAWVVFGRPPPWAPTAASPNGHHSSNLFETQRQTTSLLCPA